MLAQRAQSCQLDLRLSIEIAQDKIWGLAIKFSNEFKLEYRFSNNGLNYELYELSAYCNKHPTTQRKLKQPQEKMIHKNCKKTENNLPILKLTSEREMTKFKNGCKEFNKNL
jgi:hypothetical protein